MAEVEAIKRPREVADTGSEDVSQKKAKIEDQSTADVKNTAGPSTSQPATGAASPSTAPDQDKAVEVLYKTFKTGGECRKYYTDLLHNLTQDQNLNEYERNMVLELVRMGHPDPPRKLGCGVQHVQIRLQEFENQSTKCFFLLRSDGTEDDFSTRKCINQLFPSYAAGLSAKPAPSAGFRGRGDRGRGRGGRGGGRGRGRDGGGERGRRGRGRRGG